MPRRPLVVGVLVMLALGLAQMRQEGVLAQQQQKKTQPPLTHVLLLLDVSASMAETDGRDGSGRYQCTCSENLKGSRIAMACSAFERRVVETAGVGLRDYLRKAETAYAYLRFGLPNCGVDAKIQEKTQNGADLSLSNLKNLVCKCAAIDKTPLAAALGRAEQWVNERWEDGAKTIGVILVSDGYETCGGETEVAAEALSKALMYTPGELKKHSFVSVLFIPPHNSPVDPAVVEQLDHLARGLGARQVILATSEDEFSQGLLGALIASVTPTPIDMGQLYATQELGEAVLNVYLSDAGGNGDGAADSGEQVVLAPQVVNLSGDVLEDVTIQMEVRPSPDVDPVTVTIDIGDIEPLCATASKEGAVTTVGTAARSGSTFSTRATVASAGATLGTTTLTTAVGSVVSPAQQMEIGIQVRLLPSAPVVSEDYRVEVSTSFPNTYVEITIEGTDDFYCFDSGSTDENGVIVFPTHDSGCDTFGDGMIIGAEEPGVRETVTVHVPEHELSQTFTFTFEEE